MACPSLSRLGLTCAPLHCSAVASWSASLPQGLTHCSATCPSYSLICRLYIIVIIHHRNGDVKGFAKIPNFYFSPHFSFFPLSPAAGLPVILQFLAPELRPADYPGYSHCCAPAFALCCIIPGYPRCARVAAADYPGYSTARTRVAICRIIRIFPLLRTRVADLRLSDIPLLAHPRAALPIIPGYPLLRTALPLPYYPGLSHCCAPGYSICDSSSSGHLYPRKILRTSFPPSPVFPAFHTRELTRANSPSPRRAWTRRRQASRRGSLLQKGARLLRRDSTHNSSRNLLRLAERISSPACPSAARLCAKPATRPSPPAVPPCRARDARTVSFAFSSSSAYVFS